MRTGVDARSVRWKEFLVPAVLCLILTDAIRIALLPAYFQNPITDGLETLIALFGVTACVLATRRSSRYSTGLWALAIVFFVLLFAADFHDAFLDLSPGSVKTYPWILEALGWCAYVPLTLLIFFPFEKKDAPSWDWLMILDFLQVTLVIALAYFHYIYLPHVSAHLRWTVRGRPEDIRNVILSAGLLARAWIDPSASARSFFRIVGVAFALITVLQAVFQGLFAGSLDNIAIVCRPAVLMAIGILALRWKDLPVLLIERRSLPRWVVSLLPASAPGVIWLFAQGIPHPYVNGTQAAIAVAIGIFILRASFAERYRQRFESELQDSEHRLRAFLQHAPYAIVVFDANLERLVEANPRAERLFGCTRRELLGASTPNSLSERSPAITAIHEPFRLYSAQVMSGEEVDFERAIRNSGGDERICEVRLARVPSKARRWIHATYIDVTKRKRAEENLRQASRHWAATFNAMNDGVCLLDAHGVIERCNRSMSALLGFPPEATAGLKCRDCISECPCTKALESGTTQRTDVTWGGRWYTVTVEPYFHDSGEVAGAVQSLHDVTERRRAEDAVRLSEARYRSLIETQSDIIVRGSPAGELTFANDAYYRSFGPSMESVEGTWFMSIVAPEDLDKVVDAYRALLHPPHRTRTETRIIAPDGIRWFIWDNSAVLDNEGKVVELQSVGRDITDHKRAEEAVRRSEADLRSLVQNAPYGILRSSVDGDRLLAVNPALVRILGWESEEEVLALRLSTDVYWDSKGRAEFLARLPQTGNFTGIELRWRKKDGKPITVRVSGRRTRGSSEAEDIFEEAVEDVTEYHVLQDRFLQAQKMEAVGRLAGGIAHDFNNLLMIIMGYTQMLDQKLSPHDPGKRNTAEILSAAERAASLTQQLLAFSRKQVMHKKVLDVNALVTGIETMMARLIGEDLRVTTRLASTVLPVLGDPGQLVQVLMNLAVNARDAMPDGGELMLSTANVLLTVQDCNERPGLRPGNYVAITVSDTGTGISLETQQSMFEPFFTTKGESKGTGLGLAIVHGIVEQSGGFIEVQSELGKGTTFHVYLPVAQGHLMISNAGRSTAPLIRQGSETILLVEDESALRELLTETLRKNGYTVLQAGSGAEALMAVAHGPAVDLVVSDFVLPDIRGPRLLEKLRSVIGDVRIVYISGYAEAAAIQQELPLPGSMFLQKPFNIEVLQRTIRASLETPRARTNSSSNFLGVSPV